MTPEEIKHLDYLLREACFARDGFQCLWCLSERKTQHNTLAPSHIKPKGHYKKMRWILDNVITFCYNHHICVWHKSPTEANKWYENNIPRKRRDRLDLMAQSPIRSPLDFNLIRISLLEEIKKYDPNFIEKPLKVVKHYKKRKKKPKILSITAKEWKEKQKELMKKQNKARYQYFKNLNKNK